MTTTTTTPTWPAVERVQVVPTGDGFVRHAVTFAEDVTLDAFTAYVESVKCFGYNPCGYGGHASVLGRVGVWRRYSTCD